MKSVAFTFLLLVLSSSALAFDFNKVIDKVKNDKETQEQLKEAAKKGYEYFKGEKKEEPKQEQKDDPKDSVPAKK